MLDRSLRATRSGIDLRNTPDRSRMLLRKRRSVSDRLLAQTPHRLGRRSHRPNHCSSRRRGFPSRTWARKMRPDIAAARSRTGRFHPLLCTARLRPSPHRAVHHNHRRLRGSRSSRAPALVRPGTRQSDLLRSAPRPPCNDHDRSSPPGRNNMPLCHPRDKSSCQRHRSDCPRPHQSRSHPRRSCLVRPAHRRRAPATEQEEHERLQPSRSHAACKGHAHTTKPPDNRSRSGTATGPPER